MNLPLKLGIFVVLLFAVVIAACYMWKPLKIRYYVRQLNSDNPGEKIEAIDNLIKLGDKGKEALKKNFIEGERAAKILIDSWSDVNAPISSICHGLYKGMPLIAASSGKYFEVARILLKKGADIDGARKVGGRTALWWAIASGNEKSVEFLIDQGASIDYVERVCIEHPLDWIAFMGDYKEETHRKCIEIFFEKGGDVNAGKDRRRETPLHWAAKWGQKELCEFLISKGADIEARDSSGGRPLHMATENGHIPTIKFLLEKGANVNCERWSRTRTPFDLAKTEEIKSLLRAHGGKTWRELRKEAEK